MTAQRFRLLDKRVAAAIAVRVAALAAVAIPTADEFIEADNLTPDRRDEVVAVMRCEVGVVEVDIFDRAVLGQEFALLRIGLASARASCILRHGTTPTLRAPVKAPVSFYLHRLRTHPTSAPTSTPTARAITPRIRTKSSASLIA